MAKTRSPNYPVINLGEALEAIRPAFKAENRNKFSRIVLAKHLGYTSLNGRALGKIGAVRAYGLIDGSGDELRLSDDVIMALTAPANSDQRSAALGRLALKPQLFSDLRKAFPDDHPSMDNLRFNLIQRRFTEEAAGKAASNYLKTMALVSGNNEAYTSQASAESETKMHQTNILAVNQSKSEKAEFPLPEGVARLEFPPGLSQESYDDLEEWLKLVLRRAKRSIKPDV